MNQTLTAHATVTINAPPSTVWNALVNPEMIQQYLFGTEVVADWKVGNPILWKGVWEGKPYEDKGRILEFVPEKRLVTTHWSPLSGTPDVPENYHTVTYELAPEDGGTKLTLTQDNNATEEEKYHSEQNWKMVLGGIKKLLES